MHHVPGLLAAAGLSGAVAVADGGSLATLVSQVVVAVVLYFLGRNSTK